MLVMLLIELLVLRALSFFDTWPEAALLKYIDKIIPCPRHSL